MVDEVHIASFIVHHQPSAMAPVERLVGDMPGAEIAAREGGRCILLHECDSPRELIACMDAVQAIAGVISVNLIYHHAEPRAALDDLLPSWAEEGTSL